MIKTVKAGLTLISFQNGKSGPGRGRKSKETKENERAQKAAFLAKKYDASGSKLAAQHTAASSSADDVECEGEKTFAERDAELRSAAVCVDEE